MGIGGKWMTVAAAAAAAAAVEEEEGHRPYKFL